MYPILTTYNKTERTKAGRGYDLRPPGTPYRSLIVHTTNGAVNSRFEAEAEYLASSDKVSAHYLIGKDGRIAQVLNPAQYTAWHTGPTIDNRLYSNRYAIGVEVHYTPGEPPWTPDMYAALTQLAVMFQRTYPTIVIETHRAIAYPRGRKIDPSGFPDPFFSSWKKHLTEWALLLTNAHANVRTLPQRGASVRQVIPPGTRVFGRTVTGEAVNGDSTWYECLQPFGHVHASLLVSLS